MIICNKYFLIDDDHLAVVIGDVSGKGIPAALFMVLVKNTIQRRLTQEAAELSKAMDDITRLLIQDNPGSMFVTLRVGVLCLSDGLLRFVNAGHCFAAICRKGGVFTMEKEKHSMMAGVWNAAERQHKY